MAGEFGVSFVPGEQPQGPQGPGQPSAVSPLQQAIQFISTRLPRMMGQNALAPGGLLMGRGSNPDLERLLAQLFGSGPMGIPPSSAPPSSAPSPSAMSPTIPAMSPTIPTPHVTPGWGPPVGSPPDVPPPADGRGGFVGGFGMPTWPAPSGPSVPAPHLPTWPGPSFNRMRPDPGGAANYHPSPWGLRGGQKPY